MIKRIANITLGIFLGISLTGFSQNDSLVQLYAAQKNAKALQEEQKQLNFQAFFFEALSQKAIGNYDKAIAALESCQNNTNEEVTVNFELSKNYFLLEKYFEAISFVQKALKKEPNNVFLLEHLKKIYLKERNYKEALVIQQKIVILKPNSQRDLVLLYIRNNQIEGAKKVLLDLEKKGLLSENLIPFKESLFPKGKIETTVIEKPIENQSLATLKTKYANEKKYTILSQILTKQFQKEHYVALEKQSEDALALFPAQPFVYLMHAKALNKLKKYNKALPILQSGIDYVIDDYSIEADFYEQLSLSYKGLHKNVAASKYYNMAIETRQKNDKK